MKIRHLFSASLLGLVLISSSLFSSTAFSQEVQPSENPPPETQPLGWIKQAVIEGGTPYGLSFINSSIGWYTCEGGVYKTINGGVSWAKIASLPVEWLYPIKFLDEKNGWGIGFTTGDSIYKTVDGGITWLPTYNPVAHPRRLIMLSKDTFFVLGDFDAIGKTTDGGKTWSSLIAYVDKSGTLFDATTTDGINITAVGEEKDWPTASGHNIATATVLTSHDGGKNWLRQWDLGIANTELRRIIFLGSSTQLAINYGFVYRSTTEGGTWTKIPINLKPEFTGFTDISFSDSLNGIIIGDLGFISRTTDGGLTWQEQMSGVNTPLVRGQLFDSLRGVIVGIDGVCLSTSNAGFSWVKDELPTITTLIVQTFPDPSYALTTLKFSVPEADYFTIKVYDIIGREVSNPATHQFFAIGEQYLPIETIALPNGQYTCVVEGTHSRGTTQFMVAR